MQRLYLLILLLLLSPFVMPAQNTDTLIGRNKLKYTQSRPLIYEGAQDLWPYSFLDESGKPAGYNIDLIRLILDKLNIPYEIKMKPRLMAFQDLREGRSDLMIGLVAGFHEEFAHYSESSVTLFTQSVLSPRSKPTTIRNFRDLATHKVIVNDSSLCHHLMIDYGWGDNALPTHAIGEVIKQMSTDEEGELVWNTLSLKWLLRKFQITNLEVTPVNMPHGEYKFMSVDEHLIHLMDSVFTDLNATEQLVPLQNKWFYPDRLEQKEELSPWTRYVTWTVICLLAVLIAYILFYQWQARHIKNDYSRSTSRFALILETGGVHVWTYDIASQTFTWHNEQGQPVYVYDKDDFAKRYSASDFALIMGIMQQLATSMPPANAEEPEVTLDIKARDNQDDPDSEMRNYVMALSVLRRDRNGRPTILIGTKRDVTEKRKQQQLASEQRLRYRALFNTPMAAIMAFDTDGTLIDLNQQACDMYGCHREKILSKKPNIRLLLGLEDFNIAEADGFSCAVTIDPERLCKQHDANRDDCHLETKVFSEFYLMTTTDEEENINGVFAICCDMSRIRAQQREAKQKEHALAELKTQEDEYKKTINNFILNANLRLLNYSPQTHMLSVVNANDHVQQQLTQTRIMTLVDQHMRKRIMHIIGKMDSRDGIEIDLDVPTALRVKGRQLVVHIHLMPQRNDKGELTEYLGVLRDISDQKAVEQQLAAVEAKTQEVEQTKNSFVKNMMQEIRHPMETVIDNTEHLTPTMTAEEMAPVTNAIIGNAEVLTHIISNVLKLSRIEAHMVEITTQPTDFTQLFTACCENGWEKHKRPGVRYIAENTYDELVVNIDPDHLGEVIAQLTLNAAQHTNSGIVRTRYDYIGRRLIVSIEDTGEGMSRKRLDELNERLEKGTHTTGGLGLLMCKELLRQMGGNLEISSELGLGTAVWVTLPCNATTVKRKMIQ